MDAILEAVQRVAGPYVHSFARTSSVPESFWGALTANESGAALSRGVIPANIQRREPKVYSHLCAVAGGFEPSYGAITLKDLPDALSLKVGDLMAWGSSWGFTQIMGYHAILWKTTVFEIRSPGSHYACAGKLMAEFCDRFGIDPTEDFEQMARCWNTGQPNGQTYDPDYVKNLLARMEAWSSVATP